MILPKLREGKWTYVLVDQRSKGILNYIKDFFRKLTFTDRRI